MHGAIALTWGIATDRAKHLYNIDIYRPELSACAILVYGLHMYDVSCKHVQSLAMQVQSVLMLMCWQVRLRKRQLALLRHAHPMTSI